MSGAVEEFVRKRLNEWEHVALNAHLGSPQGPAGRWYFDGGTLSRILVDSRHDPIAWEEQGGSAAMAFVHMAAHDPHSVLRLVAVLRALVDRPVSECGDYEHRPDSHYPGPQVYPCDGCAAAEAGDRDRQWTVRMMAVIWADHLEYDPTWAPNGVPESDPEPVYADPDEVRALAAEAIEAWKPTVDWLTPFDGPDARP